MYGSFIFDERFSGLYWFVFLYRVSQKYYLFYLSKYEVSLTKKFLLIIFFITIFCFCTSTHFHGTVNQAVFWWFVFFFFILNGLIRYDKKCYQSWSRRSALMVVILKHVHQIKCLSWKPPAACDLAGHSLVLRRPIHRPGKI